MISVRVIDNGLGVACQYQIPEGTTVGEFLKGNSRKRSDYIIRKNNNEVIFNSILQSGDKISITPKRILGSGPRPDWSFQLGRWIAIHIWKKKYPHQGYTEIGFWFGPAKRFFRHPDEWQGWRKHVLIKF